MSFSLSSELGSELDSFEVFSSLFELDALALLDGLLALGFAFEEVEVWTVLTGSVFVFGASPVISKTFPRTAKQTSSSEDKLKDITESQMGSFIEYFKQDLTDKGLDISTYSFYNRSTILYMTVPNEYKTYSKADLQNFADGMLAKEHEAFNVWAAINNVNYERYPMFHIKTDDGNALASQKLNGSMEVKVK